MISANFTPHNISLCSSNSTMSASAHYFRSSNYIRHGFSAAAAATMQLRKLASRPLFTRRESVCVNVITLCFINN
ncbi:transcription factor TCP15 [Senna tora]|uniref:Transcription factor TCP15 n=1 Tax=Senna tora TaxID=362788 RepID=A0A834TM97_9FABA|nr:transcription factor TCP15 [Senna tora]